MSNRPSRQFDSPSWEAFVAAKLGHLEASLCRLEDTQQKHGEQLDMLLRGQADLTVAFGRSWQRLQDLERDAVWKTWVIRVVRVAAPALGGFAAAKWPWLAGAIKDILSAVAQ